MAIEVPALRREGNGKHITIHGATGNNLKGGDVDFQLGKLIVVTGVSGSGKSTPINEVLQPILSQHFYRSLKKPMLLPCLTKGGTAFRLMQTCNLIDNEVPHTQGAAGIGIVRSESAILYDQSEQTQTSRLKEYLRSAEGVPVVLRTCDTRADDDAPWSAELQARLGGDRLFKSQIRALLRAAPEGHLRVVFPMVKDAADWDTCLQEVNNCKDELQISGVEIGMPMLGCVIDMPSAALMAADIMDRGAQLMVIDAEDLTRYTLGLVHNPTAAVGQLTNPAVLRLVKSVVEQAAARSVPVYICGITVAAVSAMPEYLKLGVRTFSAEPAALLPLKKLLMEQEV